MTEHSEQKSRMESMLRTEVALRKANMALLAEIERLKRHINQGISYLNIFATKQAEDALKAALKGGDDD